MKRVMARSDKQSLVVAFLCFSYSGGAEVSPVVYDAMSLG
jgi:hypothetical protein